MCLCLPACMCPVLDSTKIDSQSEDESSKNREGNKLSLYLYREIVESTNIYTSEASLSRENQLKLTSKARL